MHDVKLDPARQKAALAAIEDDERYAEFYEREAKRIRASAAARRRSWGLPAAPRSPVPDTRPNEWEV